MGEVKKPYTDPKAKLIGFIIDPLKLQKYKFLKKAHVRSLCFLQNKKAKLIEFSFA